MGFTSCSTASSRGSVRFVRDPAERIVRNWQRNRVFPPAICGRHSPNIPHGANISHTCVCVCVCSRENSQYYAQGVLCGFSCLLCLNMANFLIHPKCASRQQGFLLNLYLLGIDELLHSSSLQNLIFLCKKCCS